MAVPPSPTLIYFNEMSSGFEMGIFRGIARLVREQSPPCRLRRVAKIEYLADALPDAILGFSLDDATLCAIRRLGCPFVLCSHRMLGLGIPCVVTDNEGIGRMAADFFRRRFYSSTAYVGSKGYPFAPEREQGFFADTPPDARQRFYTEASAHPREFAAALIPFLSGLPKGTGLFASNDTLARRVCEAALERGIRIPEDLAVLGADADEMVNYESEINLSSVDSDPETIGYRAAEILIRMLADPDSVAGDLVVRVPPRRVIEAQSTHAVQTLDASVLKVVQLLKRDLEKPLDIPELARQVGCSRRALEMRFARATGMGLAAFQRQQRLEAAKRLLRQSNLMIYEVAARCGYGSVYHFSNSFRKATGQTPRAYRKQGR